MSKKVIFFIESLDQGYILTEEGKQKAFSSTPTIKDYLTARFQREIDRFSYGTIYNMRIELIVEENCPTEAKVCKQE